jgi:hypothetical protein
MCVLGKKTMERDDTKRRRRHGMELAIVTRVQQGLPLRRDEMTYLVDFFDFESLNRFCSTSWSMQQFCKNNQVWRRKFTRLFPTLLSYWDRLIGALGDDPKEYRLLMSFLVLFNGSQIPDHHEIEVILFRPESIIDTLEFDVVQVDHYFKVVRGQIQAFHKYLILTDRYLYSEDARNFPLLLRTVGDLTSEKKGYYEYFEGEEDDDVVFVELIQTFPGDDAIFVIYAMLGMGYKRVYVHEEDDDIPFNEFKKIVAHIGACAHCTAPKPKNVCGLCSKVAYCNQQCADRHWRKHNCEL